MWLLFSLLAAVCFGLRGIFYHWTSQRPLDRNLMLFGVFSTGAIVCLSISLLTNQPWTYGVWLGVMMGAFSFLANASIYKGFAVGKASIVALLTSLPSVLDMLFAIILWGEQPTWPQWIAFVVIVVGVLLVRASNDISLKQLKGAQWGFLAMLFFCFNDLSSKQATLIGAAVFPTLFLMFVTGAVLFCGWWLIGRRLHSGRRQAAMNAASLPGSPWKGWKTYSWGLVVGLTNTFGMVFIYQGFKYGVTGLVAAVVSINVVLILLYARVFLKEKFTRTEFAGLCLTILGVIALSLMEG